MREDIHATVEIVGPEGVPLSFPRATLAERFVAFALDLVILVSSASLVLLLFLLAGLGVGSLAVVGVGLVFMFLIRHFYFIAFETHWHGSTPGKRLMNLRVVARDGAGLGTDAVVARNLMRDLEIFVPLAIVANPEQVFGPGPWWLLAPTVIWLSVMALMPLLSRDRSRLGDLVGGTRVVRIPIAELPPDEAARSSQPRQSRRADTLAFSVAQLSFYGERELETLAELMRKADQGKATDDDLRVVAQTIADKVGFDGPLPARRPARFLRAFYKAQRAHLERELLFGKRKASKFDEG